MLTTAGMVNRSCAYSTPLMSTPASESNRHRRHEDLQELRGESAPGGSCR